MTNILISAFVSLSISFGHAKDNRIERVTDSKSIHDDFARQKLSGVFLGGISIERNSFHSKDTSYDLSTHIDSIALIDQNIESLVLLGRVWGFLKYYHPAVAKGLHDWDNELLQMLPLILDSKNDTARNNILFLWANNLGTFEMDSTIHNDSSNVKMSPNLNWINDANALGQSLSSTLKKIKNAKRRSGNHYVSFTPQVGNPIFDEEKSYANMTYPNAGYRLLCLYRYWNIIEYYYPYKYLIGEDWPSVLKKLLPDFIHSANEVEYDLSILRMISSIHDTHAVLTNRDMVFEKYKGTRFCPLKIEFIENKAIVTKYSNAPFSKESGPSIGDVIVSINKKSIAEILKDKLPITPGSNYTTQLRDIARNLLRTNDTLLDIAYLRKGELHESKVKTYSYLDFKAFPTGHDTSFRQLDKNIGYLYPGTIKNKDIKAIMKKVRKDDALIIDFRCYPSEFVVFSLGKYLVRRPTRFVKFTQTSNLYPGLFTFREVTKVGGNGFNCFKGKIVILINQNTQSSAEYHVMAFRKAANAVVIGDTTAGADGNVSFLYLPGGVKTMFTGIGVYYPNGAETQRIGIRPDIIIDPTILGIMENRDELLEKALQIIREKN